MSGYSGHYYAPKCILSNAGLILSYIPVVYQITIQMFSMSQYTRTTLMLGAAGPQAWRSVVLALPVAFSPPFVP